MSPKERERSKKLVLSMCTCKSCPSWVDSDEQGGYCFPTIGRSSTVTEEEGCKCGGCQAYGRMALKNMYYCTRGSEKEQQSGV